MFAALVVAAAASGWVAFMGAVAVAQAFGWRARIAGRGRTQLCAWREVSRTRLSVGLAGLVIGTTTASACVSVVVRWGATLT